MKFFDELQRRNVLRVGTAYVVGAWLVIQVVDTILPSFGFGDAAVRIVTISFAVGLIPVLVIAWVYELTPEGLKKDEDVSGDETVNRSSTRNFDRAIIVILALAVSYFAFDKFVLSSQVAASQQSIAVLPFLSQGSADEEGYFADGMHYELLNRLSQISALKVISRTSVMRYRGSDKSLPQIGEELSVATLLEGSVQLIGNKVRINVQLKDGKSEEHLWAQIYDRELTAENLFGIQSEISQAIAGALHAELSPETLARIDEVQTDNSEAYDLYLRATQLRSQVTVSVDYIGVKTLLERVVDLDPNFLRANVALSEVYGRMVWAGMDPDGEYRQKALQLLSRIQERWPARYESRLALADYRYTVDRDYAAALAEYRAVEDQAPNDPNVVLGVTASLKRLNRNDEHLAYARRVVELDPENPLVAYDLVVALSRNGFGEEAIAFAEECRDKFPEDTTWDFTIAEYRLLHLGDVDAFLAYGEQSKIAGNWGLAGHDFTWLLYGEYGDYEALDYLAARTPEDYGWGAVLLDVDRALIHRFEGREDEANMAAQRAFDFARTWFESGRPLPSNDARRWYAWMALTAAVAGDVQATSSFRSLYRSAPMREPGMEKFRVRIDAIIDAVLGDPEAGWEIIAANVGKSNPAITPEYAAVHSLYQRLFGEVAGYQEFIADANILERSN